MADDSRHKRGGLSVEYAKSGRAGCKACGRNIDQDSMRIGKEEKSQHHDGWDTLWYHYKCCNKHYDAPKFKNINEIKEWEYLRWEDQIAIKKDLGEKIEKNEDEKRREKETNDLWELKDQIDGSIKSKDLKTILEANGIEVAKMSPGRMIHKVADGMLFGRIGDCPECKNAGTLRYNGFDYACKGWISGFTRCEFKGKDGVKRFKWVIPADLKKSNKWLNSWKPTASHPTAAYTKDSGEAKSENNNDNNAGTAADPEEEEVDYDALLKDDGTPEDEVPDGEEMHGFVVAIAGTKKDLGITQKDLEDMIMEHGGGIDDDITAETTVFICPEAELNKKKKTKKVQAAVDAGLPVLTVEWAENLCNREKEGIKLRNADAAAAYLVGDSKIPEGKRICIKYSKERIEKEKAKQEAEEKKKQAQDEEKKKTKRKRAEPKPGSDVLKVDSASGHDHDCDVLVTYDDVNGYVPWHAMLNMSDIATGSNKFYRMQVLKKKGKQKYWFFINYGRVGTSIGGKQCYDHGTSEASARQAMEEKFKEMTGNDWKDADSFVKKGGKYFMAALDDGNDDAEDDEALKKISKRARKEDKDENNENNAMQVDKPLRLPRRVQELVSLIFDKEMMKKQLAAMNVDIKKMPLGNISKKQIRDGYAALTEIQNLLENPNPSKARLVDATNRFYNLVPHDFGTADPPLINDLELVKKKIDMLDALCDIEIANQLMKDDKRSTEEEALEKHYAALKSNIQPVEKDTELYSLLESYAYNTHDKDYFSRFSFTVEDIFEITRDGEPEKYKDWEKNHNRMLLWHGSRLTNWVGIISQGLRIAPPEAPKTGYRFGKGVYFADVISKSGSYCFTTNQNPHAVMLLAEVALGNMNQLLKDEYMEKAPPGTHCTKALGMAAPDPKSDRKILDDVTIPCGKITKTGIKSACSHNEYIIYDTAQVRIRYLLRLKFKHDY